MVKHIHTLTINKVGKSAKKHLYDFGSTKNIELTLSETGISITAQLTKVYDKEEMLSGNSYLFPDAIKKGLLLYLIKYRKALQIKSIIVKTDDNEETIKFDATVKPPVYSMISGDVKRNIPSELSSDSVFGYLLHTPKTKYDKRIASLFALLCSKSKDFETERFLYLWTSFNGIYGYCSNIVFEERKTEIAKKTLSEYDELKYFHKLFSLGEDRIPQKDNNIIAHSAISILKQFEINSINKDYIEKSKLDESISALLVKSGGEKYNITVYCYLLTQLSYYFRCKYVHGSKPVLLFAYPDDDVLHSLSIVNNLLEEFIDKTLHLLFDDKYVSNALIPKAKTIDLK